MIEELRAALVTLDEQKRADWQRSLPIPDLLGDRWERAARLGFGARSSVYDSAIVLGDVAVGADVWVGPNTLLDGSGGPLRIGDHCNISAGTHLYTHDTVQRVLSGGRLDPRVGAVTIGTCTYIGPISVIAAGVTIGDHCVVGAGSFVNADVPDRTVVAGSPARVVGHVEGHGTDIRIVTVR